MKNLNTALFRAMERRDLRNYVFDYYRDKIQNTTVVNKQTGITINFNKVGRMKTSSLFASVEKSLIIIYLKEYLAEAKRIKTTEIKKGSSIDKNVPNSLFVINFLITASIDDKPKKFVCGIIVKNDGKFQYSLYHLGITPKK